MLCGYIYKTSKKLQNNRNEEQISSAIGRKEGCGGNREVIDYKRATGGFLVMTEILCIWTVSMSKS